MALLGIAFALSLLLRSALLYLPFMPNVFAVAYSNSAGPAPKR